MKFKIFGKEKKLFLNYFDGGSLWKTFLIEMLIIGCASFAVDCIVEFSFNMLWSVWAIIEVLLRKLRVPVNFDNFFVMVPLLVRKNQEGSINEKLGTFLRNFKCFDPSTCTKIS